MPAIRAILFDMDDTLIQRPPAVLKACLQLGRELFPEADAELQASFGRYLAYANSNGYVSFNENFAFMRENWPHGSLPDLDALRERYFRLYPTCAKPQPQLRETILTLRQRGYRLGIVTNGSVDFQGIKIRTLGLANWFDTIVCSGAVQGRKPARIPFEAAWEALGVAPEECAMVGDHPVNDILGAAQCGMMTVWIRGMFHWPVQQPRADFVVSQLVEILSIFPEAAK